MQKDDFVRLRHMFDAAVDAMSFAENKTRKSLNTDRQLVLAIVKSIEIIGEAATKITDETRNAYPQIPWASIVGMRNRLIHAYFDINLNILWKTVKKDIPALIAELEKIVDR